MKHFLDLQDYLYENIGNVSGSFSIFLIFSVSSFIYYFVLVMIHETGHFVFGIISGYRFVSFRIFKYTFVYEGKRLVLKKYSFPGSIGQCIMCPPEYRDKKHPFILYHMGGVICNTFMLMIIILLFICPLHFTKPVCFILFTCMYIEFINFLVNAIPRRYCSVNNDSTNVGYLLKNKQAVKSFYAYMATVKELLSEKTYKKHSEALRYVPADADLSNEIIALHKLNECYYHMDISQWETALSCIEAIERAAAKRSRLLKNILLSEKLFLYIKLNRSVSDIDDLYSKIKRQLYHCGIDFNFIRTRMAYELFMKKARIEEIKRELEQISKGYPYRGEALFCCNLVRKLMFKEGK